MSRRRVLIAAALLLLAIAYRLDRHPIRIDSHGPERDGRVPLHEQGRAVVLLVDAAALERGTNHPPATRPDELEWVNLLRQAFGGCDVVDARAWEPTAAHRIIVIPRTVMATHGEYLVPALEEQIHEGADVYVECPDSTLAARFGLQARGFEMRTQLPWPVRTLGPNCSGSTLALTPPDLPIPWRIARYAPVPGRTVRAVPALDLGGRPAMWTVQVGEGRWILQGIDVSDLASRIRQGEPDTDGRLRNRPRQGASDWVESNDLVVSDALLQADQAWIDALVEAWLQPGLGSSPWPRLSTAPFASDGWLLVTHDDEMFGARSRWMTSEQARRGIPSTAFFLSEPTALTEEAARDFAADSTEIGLHPRWPSDAIAAQPGLNPPRRYGLWKFHPVVRPYSLLEQKVALERLLPPGSRLQVSRNHYLLWSTRPDRVWKELSGADIRVDSSFGPDWGMAGWLFGSTTPFQPIDSSGRLVDLWEVPFLGAEQIGGLSQARLERWMRTNALGGQGAIHLLFHPDAFGWIPSADLFRMWDALPEITARHRHHATSLTEYVDWWEARERLEMLWSFDGQELAITVSGSPAAGQALLVPQVWNGRPLLGWATEGERPATRRVERYGSCLLAIELPRAPEGSTTSLSLRYAPR